MVFFVILYPEIVYTIPLSLNTYIESDDLNNVIMDSAFCVIQKLVVSLTGGNRMKKLILTIVLCAFAMVVAGLNVRSMQNRGVKEATVEAEVEDIVGMNKGSRGEISWNVIYKYSYKGKEYQKEVDGVRSCQKGEKVRVAIDSDHPDVIINFTRKGTALVFILLAVAAVFAMF